MVFLFHHLRYCASYDSHGVTSRVRHQLTSRYALKITTQSRRLDDEDGPFSPLSDPHIYTASRSPYRTNAGHCSITHQYYLLPFPHHGADMKLRYIQTCHQPSSPTPSRLDQNTYIFSSVPSTNHAVQGLGSRTRKYDRHYTAQNTSVLFKRPRSRSRT